MKAKLIFFFLFITSLNVFSQISFEKGYYIDNSNQRVECFIKNIDWKKTPKEFSYKLSDEAAEHKTGISSIKEFGIYDVTKFSKHTVEIDRSSNVLGQMSTTKEAILKKEQLFLKVLVEGKANLYKYVDNNLTRFFYKIENSIVDQLIYKRYRTKDGEVASNQIFRQQLLNDMRCGEVDLKDFRKINYRENQLVNFFIEYNKCSNSNYTSYKKEGDKSSPFHITVRPGVSFASLEIRNSTSVERSANFGNQTLFRGGVELEYVLPFNKNKWSIIIEPTYQKFTSEQDILDIPTITVPLDDKVSVDYSSIELPIGVRHYMFLNNSSKLFINASLIFDLSSNSTFDFERLPDLDIESNNNIAFGIGYNYNNKYSCELRYSTKRNLLSTQSVWNADYNYTSIIFGYTLF